MKKTQGQKRKARITLIAIVVFGLLLAGSIFIYQNDMASQYEWVDRHKETQGVVTALYAEEDEYRTLKGRRRTDTTYYVDYTYLAGVDLIESYAVLSSSDYHSFSLGDDISIWFDPDYPETNEPAVIVADGKQSGLLSALIAVGPVCFGIAYVLRLFLLLFFGGESRKKLAEGFYTENSWLDVDDNKLVLIGSDTISLAEFKDSQKSKLTELYQSGAGHSTLHEEFKEKQISSVATKDVTRIESRHDDDKIDITAGEEKLTLDFLNIGTKDHALQKLGKMLPQQFETTEVKRSRIMSALPRLLMIAALVTLGFWLSEFVLWLACGAVALYMMPTLIRRLLDPTKLTVIQRTKPETIPIENDLPKAA